MTKASLQLNVSLQHAFSLVFLVQDGPVRGVTPSKKTHFQHVGVRWRMVNDIFSGGRGCVCAEVQASPGVSVKSETVMFELHSGRVRKNKYLYLKREQMETYCVEWLL